VDSIAWRGGGGGGGGHGPGGGLPLTSDLRLRGQAAWAGCSSLEVHIELASRRGEPSGGGEPSVSGREQRDGGGWAQFGVARFVMVSRDALAGGPKPLPPLAPASALERALFASGAERDVQRRRRREAAASPGPPSAAELGALYAVVRTAAAARAASPAPLAGGGGGGGGRPVPMSATAQVFTHLMHSQDRNQMGRIFGGHVLRLCYEAAFITAVAHAGAACDPGALDDVAFHLPVPIGCILRLEARVAAVAGRLMRVHVRALRLSPAEPAAPARLTNELWLTVYSRAGDAPPVAPATIEEALEAVAAAAQADGGGGAEPLSKL
jgi:acyl-coenzyme A thioesterase 9